MITIAELKDRAKKLGVELKAGAKKADVLATLRRGLYGRRDMQAV